MLAASGTKRDSPETRSSSSASIRRSVNIQLLVTFLDIHFLNLQGITSPVMETSVTVTNTGYVIDPAIRKIPVQHSRYGKTSLMVVFIDDNAMGQRKGMSVYLTHYCNLHYSQEGWAA